MLPDWLPATLIDGFGTVFVVVVAGWAVITGKLVPRSTLEFTRAVYETRLASVEHERDEWRESSKVSERQMETVLANQAAIRTQLTTTTAFIESLPREGS